MKPLTSLDQIKKGSFLKIVAKCPKYSHNSISVKRIIHLKRKDGREWHEILINKSKNHYFHFENYIKGESQWVERVFVLPGEDRRLKL
jgi:hypothetical protein